VTMTTPIRLGIANISRLPIIVSMGLRLYERAVVETAVEPVLIARDVLLHRDVDEGLIQRDARHLGESNIDKALHVGIVLRLVADGSGGARAVDQLVHLARLVAHGVEDGIIAVIAPVEEVFG